ncbi:MAG: long-chain fatty acid--CoA ligase [Armatimonadetes bacterium]|nr:long-chain fatty acid--CoA ligase [Armatimonadota bacterium]
MKATSLSAMIREVASQSPSRPALMVPQGKGFQTITYREFWSTIQSFAAFLQSLGLQRGDRMVIVGENCAEWLYAHYAAQSLGVVTVPIYPTLPAEQAQYIAKDAGAKVAMCGSEEHAAKLRPLSNVKVEMLREERTGTLNEAEWNRGIDAIPASDIALFIYTSGTTGQPKGAMLTHDAFMTVCKFAVPYLSITSEDTFFSFLPLSHVFEQIASCLCFYAGACLGMNKSVASMASDFQHIRPSVMAAVPRFLESFMDRVLDGVKKQKPLNQKLFNLYLSQGIKKAKGGFGPLHGLLDKVVGAKIRERLGGRMRMVISGGAALPQHVAEFYMALGLNILQGYGLTETTGGSCVNHPKRNKYWTVGEPIGVELKIAEDGEILFRGPTVMVGYHNLPEETAKALDADGWFHTGDIGEMEGAALKITDRKKDLLVLGNGKNVAPQPIENRIRESKFISEAVVFGDGMDYCVALILPNAEAVRAELGLAEDAHLADNPDVKALLKREIDGTNKKLANFEMVKKWALIDEPFTIENGLLTPTLKVKRKQVREKYSDLIKSLG